MEKMVMIDWLSQSIEHDKEEFDNVVLIPKKRVEESSRNRHTLVKHTTSLYPRYWQTYN